MKPRGRYGAVDPSNPEAAGRCAIGAEVRKRSELFKQMAWRGDRLAWTGLWVCAQHMDQPHPQDRAKRLSADPVPVRDPLPNIDFKPDRIISLVPGVVSTVALGTPSVAPGAANVAPGGVSSTALGSPTVAQVLMLDGLSDVPALAFSTRLLRAAAAGDPCIRVRRSSDNAEADIGYSNGALDEAALLAHVGVGDGFVVQWYDQMTIGGGRYIRNLTAVAQPRIVLAGVMDVMNTRAAMRPLGAARLQISGGASYTAPTSGGTSLFAVVMAATTDSNRFWMGTAGDNGTSDGLREIRGGYFEGGSTPTGAVAPVINDAYLQEGSWAAFGAGVTAEFRRNGAAPVQVTTTITSPLGAQTNLFSRAGASADGGWGCEFLWFDTEISQDTRDAIEASVGGYYGITMA